MRSSAAYALMMTVLIASGCSHLRIDRPMKVTASAWPLYGGSAERRNIAPTPLEPPLSKVWEYDASAGFGPFAPVIMDSLLFIGNLQGELHGINVFNGRRLGWIDFGASISAAPVVDSRTLYIPLSQTDEGLIAYDLVNASILWSARLGSTESTPLLIRDRIYAATLRGEVVCIDKTTGTTLWTYHVPRRSPTAFIRSSPAGSDSILVVGCDDGNSYALNARDGSLRWRFPTSESVVATPSIEGNEVYFGSMNDTMYAVRLSEGTLLWKRDLDGKIYSSQALSQRHVFVGSSGGSMFCLDRENGAIIWKFKSRGAICAAPLLAGETLYFGSLDRTLYALNASTGEVVWSYAAESRIRTTPVVYHHELLVQFENRTVMAFSPERNPR